MKWTMADIGCGMADYQEGRREARGIREFKRNSRCWLAQKGSIGPSYAKGHTGNHLEIQMETETRSFNL